MRLFARSLKILKLSHKNQPKQWTFKSSHFLKCILKLGFLLRFWRIHSFLFFFRPQINLPKITHSILSLAGKNPAISYSVMFWCGEEGCPQLMAHKKLSPSSEGEKTVSDEVIYLFCRFCFCCLKSNSFKEGNWRIEYMIFFKWTNQIIRLNNKIF